MQRYLGALNFREHVRSTMTECGSFVISGSEDCQAYVWNTDTGEFVQAFKLRTYNKRKHWSPVAITIEGSQQWEVLGLHQKQTCES